MDALVTYPTVPTRDVLYPDALVERLESLGSVDWNDSDEQFTPEALSNRLNGVDVCITGWGCPTLSESVLADVDTLELELVAHVGGSIATVASPALYDRKIPVCSANQTMAPFVAEGILAYALSALRDVPAFDADLKAGGWPVADGAASAIPQTDTLFAASIGFVGLGDIGRELLALLEPFGSTVRVYDPYVSADELDEFDGVELTSLEATLETADVVSIHASKTPETIHLLDGERLATLPDGCLLVNAARGAIVDEGALVAELQSGRITAALDVFEAEPLSETSPLRDLENVVLGPHVAGSPVRHRLTETVIAEIERFTAGEPLQHRHSRERYERMTRDQLETEDATHAS
ncbi:hydroxyacid dehydrogenase [Natronolimnobius sp. AArcel1]|uniref:hydroxyacid dehydrogenase n=1 Tax=Natronolimnobius sp. AArcel1 TaxID=1679093 RepID=UPI0013ECCFEE|nr:hydroxyacid dehydrogenase [Natronolimnobius sp. AArcel1]NGM70615.1 hydroxyacid dehydrogenase [Natronolimnobius sp. AArcel1]